jgi:hypothetical protein
MCEGDRTERNGLAPRPDLAIIRKLIQEIGVFGQVIFPNRGNLALGRYVAIACLLSLAACAGDPGERLQSGRVLPLAGPEGRWVGPVTPVDPDCGLQTPALMSIGNSTFAFDPFQSTTVLSGKIGPTGDLQAEAVRPVPGNKPVMMGFLGRIQKSEGLDRIAGTLTSGRCHWSVTLRRG